LFSVYTESAPATSLVSGTETTAATSPSFTAPPAPLGIVIRGRCNVTGGATAGGYTVKCRRGTGTGGTQIGSTQTVQSSVASTVFEIPFSFVDTAPPAGQSSVYTVTLTAAGSNGTLNDVGLEVYVPEPYGEDV
jgi:hypothetical protein